MDFEWDEHKNRQNIRQHGFDFADAHQVFAGPFLAAVDTRQDYGEERWIGIGMIRGLVVVVVFTQPEPSVIRVVSLRKATKKERRRFESIIGSQGRRGVWE